MLGRDITRKLLLRSIPIKWCSQIGDSSCQPRGAGENLEDKATVDGNKDLLVYLEIGRAHV